MRGNRENWWKFFKKYFFIFYNGSVDYEFNVSSLNYEPNVRPVLKLPPAKTESVWYFVVAYDDC